MWTPGKHLEQWALMCVPPYDAALTVRWLAQAEPSFALQMKSTGLWLTKQAMQSCQQLCPAAALTTSSSAVRLSPLSTLTEALSLSGSATTSYDSWLSLSSCCRELSAAGLPSRSLARLMTLSGYLVAKAAASSPISLSPLMKATCSR